MSLHQYIENKIGHGRHEKVQINKEERRDELFVFLNFLLINSRVLLVITIEQKSHVTFVRRIHFGNNKHKRHGHRAQWYEKVD